jgi:hypothetical protein
MPSSSKNWRHQCSRQPWCLRYQDPKPTRQLHRNWEAEQPEVVQVLEPEMLVQHSKEQEHSKEEEEVRLLEY